LDDQPRKTAWRITPDARKLLTSADSKGQAAAATVDCVAQTSFKPPPVGVGVKAHAGACNLLQDTRHFAPNVPGKGQQGLAFAFFKPAELDCRLLHVDEPDDQSMFVGEVVKAGLWQSPDGRPDDATRRLRDPGEKVCYGG